MKTGNKLPINLLDLQRQRTVEGVPKMLKAMAVQGEVPSQALQQALGLKDAEHLRKSYLLPALMSGLVEMTLPDTPRSSKQRYRLTLKGQQWLALHEASKP